MINRSDDEIRFFLLDMFPDLRDREYNRAMVRVDRSRDDGRLLVSVFTSYDDEPHPALTFKTLAEVAAFFGTDSIDAGERREGGCESCDYGSEYGFDLLVGPKA